jgi:DNA-binding NarL/FixJ family response regulator
MRGRSLSNLEFRHLRHLHVLLERADEERHERSELLEDFVLELRDSGASARGIAEHLHVSPSTIQVWTKNARRRRDTVEGVVNEALARAAEPPDQP